MLSFIFALLLVTACFASCPCTNCYPIKIGVLPGAQEYWGLNNVSAPCGVTGSYELASFSTIVPDSYALMALSWANFLAWQNGAPFTWYSQWSVLSPTVSCYQSSYIETTDVGFMIVLTCDNTAFDCHYMVSTVGNYTSGAMLTARPCPARVVATGSHS